LFLDAETIIEAEVIKSRKSLRLTPYLHCHRNLKSSKVGSGRINEGTMEANAMVFPINKRLLSEGQTLSEKHSLTSIL